MQEDKSFLGSYTAGKDDTEYFISDFTLKSRTGVAVWVWGMGELLPFKGTERTKRRNLQKIS
jgi:hypothetical protein